MTPSHTHFHAPVFNGCDLVSSACLSFQATYGPWLQRNTPLALAVTLAFLPLTSSEGPLPEDRTSSAFVEARCLPHPGLGPPILLATSANPVFCSRAGTTAMLQSQFRPSWDLWSSTVQISQELYPGVKLSSKPLILCSCTLVL